MCCGSTLQAHIQDFRLHLSKSMDRQVCKWTATVFSSQGVGSQAGAEPCALEMQGRLLYALVLSWNRISCAAGHGAMLGPCALLRQADAASCGSSLLHGADLPVLQGTGAMVGPCPLLGQPDAASCGALRDAMPRYPGRSNTTFVKLNVRHTPWGLILCCHPNGLHVTC